MYIILTIQSRSLIRQVHQLLIQIPDPPPGVPPPLCPDVLQLVPVPGVGHDELELRLEVETAFKGLVVSADLGGVVDGEHVVYDTVVLE